MPTVQDVQIIDEQGGIAEIHITTDQGTIIVIGHIYLDGDILVVDDVHVYGPGAGVFGPSIWKMACQILRSMADVDGIRIFGARRTTGKGAGKIPRPITITRSRCRSAGLA